MAKASRTNGAAREVPSGIEILVAKAAADPRFRRLLLKRRSLAASALELDLTPAEAAILKSVPARQLEAMIDAVADRMSHEARKKGRKKLKTAAGILLAAVGAGALKLDCQQVPAYRYATIAGQGTYRWALVPRRCGEGPQQFRGPTFRTVPIPFSPPPDSGPIGVGPDPDGSEK